MARNPNRWQHYVPVGYLTRWSSDPLTFGRGARVWRTSAMGPASHAPCDTICAAEFTYSQNTALEKDTFENADSELPRLVRAVLDGTLASGTAAAVDHWHLFRILALLGVRNPDYDLEQLPERLDRLMAMWLGFLAIVLSADLTSASTPKEKVALCSLVLKEWQMSVLVDMERRLVTSENPCVVVRGRAKGTGELWCPISPEKWVRFGEIGCGTRVLTRDEVATLNRVQVYHSTGAVFSLHRPERSALSELQAWFAERPKLDRKRSATSVVVQFLERNPIPAIDA